MTMKLNEKALEQVTGGARRIVHNDAVGYANIRHTPGLNGRIAAQVPNGTVLITTGATVKRDGYIWYEVHLEGGSDEAWIAGSLIGY